jgi:hypothetical protein
LWSHFLEVLVSDHYLFDVDLLCSAMPFPKKQLWFRNQCNGMLIPWESGHVEIEIVRDDLLRSSMEAVEAVAVGDLRKIWRFKVRSSFVLTGQTMHARCV